MNFTHKNLLSMLLVAFLLTSGVLVGFAQDDHTALIQQAVENTRNLDSYVSQSEQLVTIDMGDMSEMFGGGEGLPGMGGQDGGQGLPGMGGEGFGMEISQTIESRKNAEGHVYTIVTQEFGGALMAMMGAGAGADPQVIEVLERGDETWYRFSGGSGMMDMGMPEGWFQADDVNNPEAMGLGDYGSMADSGPFDIELLDGNGVTITEVEGDTLNGQSMRVFEITYDEQAIQANIEDIMGAMDSTSQDALGGMEGMEGMFANATITQRVWVGVDDTLIHRTQFDFNTGQAEMELPDMPMPMSFSQTVTGTTELTSVNEPVDIPDPSAEG